MINITYNNIKNASIYHISANSTIDIIPEFFIKKSLIFTFNLDQKIS